ncbi:hypothetical protein H2200_011111 [Cladophialophora chaetospira]|uniref:Tubulin-specific chaperone D C-terminal domain-containing protein n=1 Tax=Cladophialophora chaetospira TaxID=386627 RepID=A0AA38X046_9EURO|nr:hypothetical protein H2200_011111 [Cladophialophora chaetospira]
MDASELDLDAKLYKASSTLLSELQYKLPLLFYHPGAPALKLRTCVLDTKCAELTQLLDRFQEWPQLLDPSLASLIQVLCGAFLGYLTTLSDRYGSSQRQGTASISPLPRAVSRLLYAFCKVRGSKVIVRLLNNEPKYLGLLLSTFRAWDIPTSGMTWEERYIMLLWLSHLMLAPFELANISVGNGELRDAAVPADLMDLPGAAGDVISLALHHLGGSGKEREAASILLVRLCLRKDMQEHVLPQRLVRYSNHELLTEAETATFSPYRALGFLSLLYGITNSGSDSDVATYLQALFDTTLKITTDPSRHLAAIRDSAPARKWILKIFRSILTHALSLSSRKGVLLQHKVNEMLEECIQYFLDALGDKDTPVRMAAAKGLSVVALKLDPAMSAEVVEAVLGCLQENVLLEDPHTQRLVAVTDKANSESVGMKRNISAVDSMRWHGLMLTLAHLLFRRSPPPYMLSEVIQALILGLEFEQRSNVGTSLGVGVRDAACFGMWALARKYSTSELNLVSMTDFAEASSNDFSDCRDVLQLIAVKLVISATLDPSGNIRRGSSAALQELIGRHPDTIVHGIPLVQIVDYHAIARLSRAMTEVSPLAAGLDPVYHKPLSRELTDWRGARAADVNQRRWAANTLQTLTENVPVSQTLPFTEFILGQLLDLKPTNIGTTAAARHGLLLGLAATLRSVRGVNSEETISWLAGNGSPILDLERLTGKLEGRTTADIELVMEAVTVMVGTVCKCLEGTGSGSRAVKKWVPAATNVLNNCTVAATRDVVVDSSARAIVELVNILPTTESSAIIETWLDSTKQNPSTFASKGRLKALSLLHGHLGRQTTSTELQQKITSYVVDIINGNFKIETRVDAMEALGTILVHSSTLDEVKSPAKLSQVLQHGLTDYSNDQRGDIGSILRLQTLETVDAYSSHIRTDEQRATVLCHVMPIVVKLAAEKLNNVRFRAWRCLGSHWQRDPSLPLLSSTFLYPAEVASYAYFQQLVHVLSVPWAQRHLILGLISSATSGSEDICRAASGAFISYMHTMEPVHREALIATVSQTVLEELVSRAAEDDRHVVPLLDFLCLMIDQNLFSAVLLTESNDGDWDFWTTMQTIHGPTSTLPRIEASLNVYSRLLSIGGYRGRALDKLTRQLLHRWPKVGIYPPHTVHADLIQIRNVAADLLYLDTPGEALASADWNAPIVQTKPIVLDLRKQLGVVSHPASKA